MGFDIEAGCRLADSLADDTIASIIGPWPDEAALDASALARIGLVNRLMSTWGNNASLPAWQAPEGTDPAIALALQAYLQHGSVLPDWAERDKVERAERIFMEEGPLSCTLLFCASLPQCYVMPNLADVLHIAGQLEAHTEHRIRQTAAMIFPVMMRGGLMAARGNGLAQVLKVRLIHATIRHLILHGHPQNAKSAVASLPTNTPASGMHDALMRHGWNVAQQGVPCNQTQLAYTLLTFSYVFLQGMRTLNQALPREDEQAYLHAWNVMGHVLGIGSEAMTHTMPQAQAMFENLQSQARSASAEPDVRPALGQALMKAMARSLEVPVIQHLPIPMTQWLVGSQTAQEIGLGQQASWWVRGVFVLLRSLVALVDRVGRLFSQKFSISRVITRIMGYHLLSTLLLSQTRPLALPDEVLDDLQQTVASWGDDPKALDWINRWEDQWTRQGAWRAQ